MKLSNKVVLVTGADGFIGSHLVEALVGRCQKVKALVFYNSFGKNGWLDNLPKELLNSVEIIYGDIRDSFGIRDAMNGVDVCFHLAALIAIPYSYSNSDSYIETNIKGSTNVMHACRDAGCEKLLITSTSEVYGTAKYVPIDESHPLQGQSPYSATKISADKLAESFYKSFDLPLTIVRPFNTYGPRQSARAVIPTVITQLLSGVDVIKLGNLKPTRDFNYVTDTAKGFIAIAESDNVIGEEINIATGIEISIGEFTNEMIRQINPNARIELDPIRLRPSSSEVERLLGCNKKIKKLTNWQPEIMFQDGISKTIEWFSEPKNLSLYNSNIYNI